MVSHDGNGKHSGDNGHIIPISSFQKNVQMDVAHEFLFSFCWVCILPSEQVVFCRKRPNAWCRFWMRALLGIKWVKVTL